MANLTATPETRSVRLLKVGEQVRHVLAELLTRQEVHDEVPEQSPRRQLTNRRHVALRRPKNSQSPAGAFKPRSAIPSTRCSNKRPVPFICPHSI